MVNLFIKDFNLFIRSKETIQTKIIRNDNDYSFINSAMITYLKTTQPEKFTEDK